MLKQLRRKFILLNMLLVVVVVVALLAFIGFANYQQSVSSAYSSLEESISLAARETLDGDNGFGLGAFSPDSQGFRHKEAWGHSEAGPDDAQGFFPQMGGKKKQNIPAAVYREYEGRNFTLVVQATTASLSQDLLAQALAQTSGVTEGNGALPDLGLIYKKSFVGGYTFIAFADEAYATTWQGLVIILIGIGLLTILVFFVISLFFSKWALKPVEDTWIQQRQFIADASHELKTPITVILANMTVMLKHPGDTIASQSQWVESTQKEAQGMQDLVTDLLDLARLENDRETEIPESVNLSELAEERILQFESVAFESNVFAEYSVEDDAVVNGSKTKLERAVTILLDNACKYADPGSTVTISLQKGTATKPPSGTPFAMRGTLPKGQCAMLSVNNKGAAVDEEDLPHLFDRFYRSDKARVRTEGSYGLGLAIAAETVMAHHGCIFVQSSNREGTTFTVTLPLA